MSMETERKIYIFTRYGGNSVTRFSVLTPTRFNVLTPRAPSETSLHHNPHHMMPGQKGERPWELVIHEASATQIQYNFITLGLFLHLSHITTSPSMLTFPLSLQVITSYILTISNQGLLISGFPGFPGNPEINRGNKGVIQCHWDRELSRAIFLLFKKKSVAGVSAANRLLTFLIPEVGEQTHLKEEQTQNKAPCSTHHLTLSRVRLRPWEKKLVLVIFIWNPTLLIETLRLRASRMREGSWKN